MIMLRKFRKILEKEKSVAFAYIFGSYLRNPKYSGDIDIAIFLKKKAKPRYESELALKIEKETKKNVDIIILNDKPLAIVSEVLRSGKLIFSENDEMRVKFETKAMDEILSFNEIMKEFDKKRLEKYGIR